MARMNRRTLLNVVSVKFVTSAWLALFCLGCAVPMAWGTKKPPKTIATADGRPVRKVYVRAASHDMASSAANQLAQDTCLVPVPDPKQADAVLKVGVALHAVVDGAGLATPNVFGPSARQQPPVSVNNVNSGQQRSASVTCSDSKQGNGGCSGSSSAPAGDTAPLPSGAWPGNAGGNLDVSLVSPDKSAQELWEPEAHSDKSWGNQLRIAAGCPVCPNDHFNRHKYKTYRNWMEDKCPAVLGTPEAQ